MQAARPSVSEKRRQELVLAAYHEIAERGFEGLRTREVAASVGVNIATAPHGSPSEQLRNYLRSVRTLLVEEPELGAVMAELALRSVRDESIGSIMNRMYDTWHVTLRGLLRRAVREGGLRPELDSDAVAALIIATLTSMTLPVMTDPARGDRALRQLERWLGVASTRQPSRQATD